MTRTYSLPFVGNVAAQSLQVFGPGVLRGYQINAVNNDDTALSAVEISRSNVNSMAGVESIGNVIGRYIIPPKSAITDDGPATNMSQFVGGLNIKLDAGDALYVLTDNANANLVGNVVFFLEV